MAGRPEPRQNRRATLDRSRPTLVLVWSVEAAPTFATWGDGAGATQRLARWMEVTQPDLVDALVDAWDDAQNGGSRDGEARALLATLGADAEPQPSKPDLLAMCLPHGHWCGMSLRSMCLGTHRQRAYLRYALKAGEFDDDPVLRDALQFAVEAIKGMR